MSLISFFFSSRRRHTIWPRDWSSDVCSSDLHLLAGLVEGEEVRVVATAVSEVQADGLGGHRRQSFRVIEVHQRGLLGHRLVPHVTPRASTAIVALVLAAAPVAAAPTETPRPPAAGGQTSRTDGHALRTSLDVIP